VKGPPGPLRAEAWWFVPGLAVITIVAASVSVWHLGRESLWMDEGVSLAFARASWLAVPFRDNGNGALYLVLLKCWTLVFSGEASVRFLSVMPFVATIPVVGLLGRRISGPLGGVVAASVVAVNADSLFWARAARGYSLEMFLTTLGMLLFVVGVDERRRGALLTAVIVGSCAAWVQPIAAVAFFMVVLSLWLVPRQTLPVAPGKLLALLAVLVSPLAVALATAGTEQISWLGSGGFGNVPGVVLNMAGGHRLGIPILILGGVGALVAFFEHRADWHTVAAWRTALPVVSVVGTLIVVLVVSVRQSLIDDAYILLLLPSTAVLVGLATTVARWGRIASALVAATVLASMATVVHRHGAANQEDLREAEAAIAARSQPGDVIVLNPTPLAGGFEYYLDLHPTSFPDAAVPTGAWGALPVNDQDDISGRYLELVRATAGRDRVWFVQRRLGSAVTGNDVRAMVRDGRSLVTMVDLPELTIELYARSAASP
jgi:mannosyltransferase